MTDDFNPETFDRLRNIIRGGGPADAGARYRKEEKLGEGGMGEVWKAWDHRLGRYVALKILKGDRAVDRERFRREGRTAAGLSHPHILPIHDVGEMEDRLYIAMEYIEGKTLDASGLDARKAVKCVRDAGRAVDYAHGEGILHRDLKPQNMLLDARDHLWVTDFGLARQMEGGGTLTVTGILALTVTGILVGTPAYMPPEQAANRGVDARSDVYALGATLYHLLTGAPPFEGSTAIEILDRLRNEDPPPPGAHPDLDTVVLKAMEKDPRRRYASAGEFAEDLDRWLKGEPVRARPPSLARRVTGRVRKHPVLSAAAGVFLLAAGIIAAIVLTRHDDARRLGEEGLSFAGEGRFDEALRKLEQSTALRESQKYRDELERIQGQMRIRRRAARLGSLYDETLRKLDADIRKVEEWGFGAARSGKKESDALLARVEKVLAEIEDPWKESSLPHTVRGWVLCNMGRASSGKKELIRASEIGREQPGDPYGRVFMLRWLARKFFRRIDLGVGRIPDRLVEDLGRFSKRLASAPKTKAPPHPGFRYRYFIHALAAAAQGDFKAAAKHVESLSSDPRLQAEALLFVGVVHARKGNYKEAEKNLAECLKALPNCSVGWHWRGRVLEKLKQHAEAAEAYEKAYELNGKRSPELLRRMERAKRRK